MIKNKFLKNGIPVSVSLLDSMEAGNFTTRRFQNKKRIFRISIYAFLVAVCISLIAKLLVFLINLVTNICFYGRFSIEHVGPAGNQLGFWVIIIPVIGGLIVGLMALFGSKAIRGHGIPEAMEQILVNQSKIKPAITYLKPISSAIAIGTGGPFGAEGPIIATGGALGSTLGQLLKITHNERKILLAAGATAGMSAIFGSPIAAIFLAIELLLFEFSPRSIIPVALACITGAAGHHFLFEKGAVFQISSVIEIPSNTALFIYSIMGLVLGVLAVLVSKCVYFVEDCFEKIPIHWAWWPALGGLVVGIVGYFAPRTMGVGYENITGILAGNMPMQVLLSLCLLKFLSWVVALGSGTSGGTLAPLLTIGGATGILLGNIVLYLVPDAGITPSLAALVGMSAMFAGASRALLTSIIFALETTSQSNSLLALLAGCTASYFVSFFLMENTIMTEKIVRRGIKTPGTYEPDLLEKTTVAQVLKENKLVLGTENSIGEVREWLNKSVHPKDNYFIVVDNDKEYLGIVNSVDIFNNRHNPAALIGTLIKQSNSSVSINSPLSTAVRRMSKENIEVLPVVSDQTEKTILGVLTYRDILKVYKHNEHERKQAHISLKRRSLKILIRGKNIIRTKTSKYY